MLYESERGDFTMMLLGDVMPTRRLAVFGEERYLETQRNLPQRRRHFCQSWKPPCIATSKATKNISGGTYMTTEPQLLEDLKWLGVNLVSTANNHAFDYGEDGIMATCGYLDSAGIAHAGTGRHLREARAPGISRYETRSGCVDRRDRDHAAAMPSLASSGRTRRGEPESTLCAIA